jgi:hypothetical protein
MMFGSSLQKFDSDDGMKNIFRVFNRPAQNLRRAYVKKLNAFVASEGAQLQ